MSGKSNHPWIYACQFIITNLGNEGEYLLSHSQKANAADDEVGQCKLYSYVYVYNIASCVISLVRKKSDKSAAATNLPADQPEDDTPPNNSKQAMSLASYIGNVLRL